MEYSSSAQNYHFETAEIAAPMAVPAKKQKRWSQLDLARGLAITLMILSHCVKGLLAQSMIPAWGMVPIHLVTKFSSSLFILVFGVSLSVYFLPHTHTEKWPEKRAWMIKRGILLMFWYKVLTVVQMFQFYPQSMIVDTLMFRSMPDFVEILCFYAIALIWLPFALPLWSRSSFIAKLATIVGMLSLGQWLHFNFDFWGIDSLKAIIAENKGYYTFGQLQRGALIFFGLMIGDFYKKYKKSRHSNPVPYYSILGGLLGLCYFFIDNSGHLLLSLKQISRNIGKHPFNADFAAFSLGGALLILGLCLIATQNIQKLMKPLAYLGKQSMNAFILHIIIIFYFYRYFFGLHRSVSYQESLALTGLCVASIIFLLYIWNKTKTVF